MKRNRPLDTRQLQVFEMLADTGSFTAAAKKMFLTQSAVSHSMKSLEEDLACSLFRRQGKKATLTEAGERLLEVARPVLRSMEEARAELDGFDRYGSGRLRLGASAKSCQFLLPPILRRFREEFPRCRFEVKSADTPRCLEMLRENEVDLSITLEPDKTAEVKFVPWFSDELRVVVPPSHPWAEKGWMNREDLHEQNFILYNKGSYTFRLIMEYLKGEGVRLSSFMELSSVEATKELIKVGVGIGILATWAVEKEVEAGELVIVRPARRKLARVWGLSAAKGRKLNEAELAFTRIGEEVGCKWMVNRET